MFRKNRDGIITDNYYISSQILTAISYLNSFLVSCRSAAKEDDGVIDENEQKVLSAIEDLTKEYQDRLRSLVK